MTTSTMLDSAIECCTDLPIEPILAIWQVFWDFWLFLLRFLEICILLEELMAVVDRYSDLRFGFWMRSMRVCSGTNHRGEASS